MRAELPVNMAHAVAGTGAVEQPESLENPFGDRHLYAGRTLDFLNDPESAAGESVESATSVVYVPPDVYDTLSRSQTLVRLAPSPPQRKPPTPSADPYAYVSESVSVQQRASPTPYRVPETVPISEHFAATTNDSLKAHILARPKLLLNVLVFWINSVACHGLPQHNRTVLHALDDLRHFYTTSRGASSLPQLDQAVRDVERNLRRLDYDTTAPIVAACNAVGASVLRDYLVARGVVSPDPAVADMATVWAEVIAAADPTVPFGPPKVTSPSRLLDLMLWSQQVQPPRLARIDPFAKRSAENMNTALAGP